MIGTRETPLGPSDRVAGILLGGRLRRLFEGRWTLGSLVAFHTAIKLQLLAHSPEHHRRLGRLVANAKGRPPTEVEQEYSRGLMEAMASPATRGRHVNVLQHVSGYLGKVLDPTNRTRLHGAIEDYAQGLVPLCVPLRLVALHVRQRRIGYLESQTYLAGFWP